MVIEEKNIFQLLELFLMIYGMRSSYLLPPEKGNKTIGRPVVHFRKVLNGIVTVLSIKLSMEDAPQKSMVPVDMP